MIREGKEVRPSDRVYQAGHLVRHYGKGTLYAIMSVAPDTETKKMCVNYFDINLKEPWKRDLDMFSEDVFYNDEWVPRFRVVSSVRIEIEDGTFYAFPTDLMPYTYPNTTTNMLVASKLSGDRYRIRNVSERAETVTVFHEASGLQQILTPEEFCEKFRMPMAMFE